MVNARKGIIGLAIMAGVLCCCATTLTPAQRVLWATNVYLAQYDLYLEQVIDPTVTPAEKDMLKRNPELITGRYLNPAITDAQREVLRVKKQILMELKPIVVMAIQYQRTGTLPPAELQNKLIELINKLVAMAEE